MIQLAIRCQPRVPVSAEELEQWLKQQVDHLRAEAPQGTVRLSRLTQELPSVDIDIGWLLELELPEGERLLGRDRLADPHELSYWPAQQGGGAGPPAGSVGATNGADS
jgi:hypothetical protein